MAPHASGRTTTAAGAGAAVSVVVVTVVPVVVVPEVEVDDPDAIACNTLSGSSGKPSSNSANAASKEPLVNRRVELCALFCDVAAASKAANVLGKFAYSVACSMPSLF